MPDLCPKTPCLEVDVVFKTTSQDLGVVLSSLLNDDGQLPFILSSVPSNVGCPTESKEAFDTSISVVLFKSIRDCVDERVPLM